MKKITVVMPYSNGAVFKVILQQFIQSPLTEKVIIIHDKELKLNELKCEIWKGRALKSGAVVKELIRYIKTKYMLLVNEKRLIYSTPEMMQRFIDIADSTKAGIVYSDYHIVRDNIAVKSKKSDLRWTGKALHEHPVNDYQAGSVRDDFDFGPIMFISIAAARNALKKYGENEELKYAGLYDLRLKMSIAHSFFHIRELLYGTGNISDYDHKENHFDYLEPRNELAQREMEVVFTQYLKNIGAYLKPEFKQKPKSKEKYPVEASVVVPVKNRKKTVTDAIKSVLAQKTDFSFNVMVVDNHSTDGTTEIVAHLANRHPQIIHIVPERFDLSIGGCWNEAVFSKYCGRWAMQLDSDDLYSSPGTLQKIVNAFQQNDYAMVIGAYLLVNEKLKEIPPGLIDHREWSDDNGRNNALRINGLGAPRAYDTEVLRKVGFLNVGYGEDYAVTLRILREYRIGRLYTPLYLCRRWTGNTDARLSIREQNINNAFKDSIRSIEIMARQKMNRAGK